MPTPPRYSLPLPVRRENNNQVGLSLRQLGLLMGRAGVDIRVLSVLSASLLCTLVKYTLTGRDPPSSSLFLQTRGLIATISPMSSVLCV